jgi:hypothetical protein
MGEVSIYDSQGQPVGERGGPVNERIRDFFFDGVQLVVDSSGSRTEIVCFLRARESEASRSEQYYAVFETSRRNAGNFGEAVKRRIEDDLGLILETSTEDTTVFELLRAGEQPSPPLSDAKIDSLLDLLDNTGSQSLPDGHVAKVGAGSYRDALALCREFTSRRPTDARYAITENVDSSRLQHFDIVIEHGSYAGIEFFEETKEAIERVRNRRRRRRQPTPDAPFGPDDTSSGVNFKLVGGGVLLLFGMAIFGTFGLCMFAQVNVPVAGDLLGTSCSGVVFEPTAGSEKLNQESFTFNGTLKQNGQAVSGTVTMNITLEDVEEQGGPTKINVNKTATIPGRNTSVSINNSEFGNVSGNYTYRINIINATKIQRLDERSEEVNTGANSSSIGRIEIPRSIAKLTHGGRAHA